MKRSIGIRNKGLFPELNRRISTEGFESLPTWLIAWTYWNGRVYRLLPPKRVEPLRLAFKYRKRKKKYDVRDPIIVYQMGKVGSNSIYQSLKELDLDVPVYHIHWLDNLDYVEKWTMKTLLDQKGSLSMLREARDIRRKIDADPDHGWNVISLVRPPVPRLLSSFFEDLPYVIPDFAERYHSGSLSPRDLVDYFSKNARTDWAAGWFDSQVKSVFGIDVFASPFPKSKGFDTYVRRKTRLLIIRLSDLNRCAGDALNEFLGIPDFALRSRHIRQETEYGSLYSEFLELMRLPVDFVREINSSKYAKHFFTLEELEASVERWLE